LLSAFSLGAGFARGSLVVADGNFITTSLSTLIVGS
jgi:hypothetical protein